jgi:thioredoxin-related protein
VTGTPGNVIIDKQTGKFVLIPGAYPAEKFVEEIEKMKAK